MALINGIIMEFCRLCQSRIGKIRVEYDTELSKKIIEVTRIELNDELNTYLPMSVCVTCQDRVLDTYSFIQTVQKVDKCLRSTIRKKYFLDIENTSPGEVSGCEDKPEDILKCDKCPALFSDQTLLKIHVNSHTNGTSSYTCPICFKTYSRTTIFNVHKKRHPELYCSKCEKLFENEIDRKVHECLMRHDKSNNLRKKNRRKAKFRLKAEVIDFPTFPREGDTFQCDTCGHQFNSKDILRDHVKIHRNFVCSQQSCFKEFPSAYSLKVHKLNHLGKKHLCVTCGKCFATKNSLTCHEKIHLDVKGYKCDICNIGFAVKSNLRTHTRKYHEGMRFYCSQCTREFLNKCSLDRHEKTHSGVKEFKCEQCTSAFYTNKELLKHQRYHEGVRLYKCEECFKTFFERHHLISHLRSHSGERPYVCKIPGCGKSFVDSQKLKRHHTAKHN